ncbi:MAG: CRISPR-associated endonuclease Cas2 [Rhodospirillales bacterium]|nr:CRISPR-associated endonuclease Cas2 [Rhodospirillales bacterium]
MGRRKPPAESGPALSGYRIVWLIVLFDLPVASKMQRSAATRFRHDLLDEGFEMSKYSMYLRHCAGKEQADALGRRVALAMPNEGKVHGPLGPTVSVAKSREVKRIVAKVGIVTTRHP